LRYILESLNNINDVNHKNQIVNTKLSGSLLTFIFLVSIYLLVISLLFSRSISSTVHTVSSLLLCDSPGFQNPASCGRQTGATFEDLCHNYLQERLQLLFHHTTLVAPKDRYEIWTIDSQISYLF